MRDGEILYVGKAATSRAGSGSYFQPSNVQPKVQALVAKTASMEVTITNSDTEALLLEYNLIKKHRPRFNVVLRDDKSFPYLHLETEHEFPRLSFYRGSRKEAGPLLRAVSVGRRGARDAAAAAEAVSPAQLRGHLFRQPLAALSAVSDPALHGALRRAHIARRTTRATSAPPSRCWKGATMRCGRTSARRMEAAAERLQFEEAAQLRDQLAKLKVDPGAADRHGGRRSRCRRDRDRRRATASIAWR